MSEPTPGRVIGQDGRDLREREDEDEVEEELERSDPLLALGVLFAHSRTVYAATAARSAAWAHSAWR